MNTEPTFQRLEGACPTQKTVLVQCALEGAEDPQGVLPLQLQAYKTTIEELQRQQNKVIILVAHPKAESVRYLQKNLAEVWGTDVAFCPDCTGRAAKQAIKSLPPGHVLLLENTYLYKAESENDVAFAKDIAALADAYVHEALGQWHLPYASLSHLPALLPAYLGMAHAQDVQRLKHILHEPQRPLTVALGGHDLSLLMPALKYSITFADQVLLAGSLTSVALLAKDMAAPETDAMPYDIENLRDLWVEAGIRGCRILVTQDVVYPSAHGQHTCDVAALPPKEHIIDVGPATIDAWSKNFQRGGTVFWHGSLGAHGLPDAAEGTNNLANALIHSPATVYVSGLDVTHTLKRSELLDHLTHYSPVGDGILHRLVDMKL